MKKSILIKGATIYEEENVIERGDLLMEHGKISVVSTTTLDVGNNVEIIDGKGLAVLPGFIDVHIHGAKGADTMDATPTAIATIAQALPEEGTTSFLATTMTQSHQQIERALENIAIYDGIGIEAEVLGIHLEGPFIHPDKKGAQPEEYIVPASIELFNDWQKKANGLIKTITLAPECDHVGLIPYLYDAGVHVSAGHTTANFSEIKASITKGVRQLTHLTNAMSGIHHREVGAVGAAFLLEELVAEVIADGVHLIPEMMEIIYQQLGSDRIILITDAMRAKALPDGQYELGGQIVQVEKGRATLADGTLAGSIVTMIEAVRNMLKISSVTLADIIKMTAVNPAKHLQIFHRKGSIKVGKDADIVVLDDKMMIKYTICQGKIAYKEESK